MKNIIVLSTALIYLISCGEKNNSATSDLGNSADYVKYQQEKVSILATNNNTNISSKDNNEASIQEVISDGGPIIEFTDNVWNFGEIQQGESVDHVFQFINTGSEPLIISNAKGSCGCTVPEWPKEAILPNEMGEIAVQFNSGEKKGRQNKTVTLTTNCTPNTTILRVVGNILTD